MRLESRFNDFSRFLGPSPSGKILELGCGTGAWTQFLSRTPLQVTALELSDDLIRIAQARLAQAPITFVQGDCEKLPFEAESFDHACGLSVLHHLDIRKVFRELHRVLKPRGKLWFSEPNMLNPQIMLQKNIPPLKRWLGDTPDETAFFRWPLARRLSEAGFHRISVVPIDFLHPQIPDRLAPAFERFGAWLESVPLVREIGGSLLVHAEK